MLEVVAAALVVDGHSGPRLLLAQRTYPPELAGLWELPGGKVAPGESRAQALRRELIEELTVRVGVGRQVGMPVPLSDDLSLVALHAWIEAGEVAPQEHSQVRWVTADELVSMSAGGLLVANDAAWVPDLVRLLAPS